MKTGTCLYCSLLCLMSRTVPGTKQILNKYVIVLSLFSSAVSVTQQFRSLLSRHTQEGTAEQGHQKALDASLERSNLSPNITDTFLYICSGERKTQSSILLCFNFPSLLPLYLPVCCCCCLVFRLYNELLNLSISCTASILLF